MASIPTKLSFFSGAILFIRVDQKQ